LGAKAIEPRSLTTRNNQPARVFISNSLSV
jgi:hypothetical protein